MQGDLTRYTEPQLAREHVDRLLQLYAQEEVARRFDLLEEWLGRYHKTNHDGTVLTRSLTEYLSQRADFAPLLDHLGQLREKTRNGGFDIGNRLQRDLEFRRFEYEYTRILEPLTYVLHGRYDPPLSTPELFAEFERLKELPEPAAEEFSLDERQNLEVRRAAYEAAGFLAFLREFRSRTKRPILLIGNDRFGRQWFVEPLTPHLGGGFDIEYQRVRSGTSTRMSIPSPFPRSTVARLDAEMPHVIIADGCHAPAREDILPLSRGLRAYGHWFVAFNDLRCDGDLSAYGDESGFGEHYLRALRRWHDFAAIREFIEDWVHPGPAYCVSSWGPQLYATVQMGDEPMPRNDVELAGDRPLVILANPIDYRTAGDDIADPLRGTTPRYFDDPDQHYANEVVFGFGPYGLETRRKGVSTEKFVRTVQKAIAAELNKLLP